MKVRKLLPLLALALAPACKSSNDHDTAIIVYVQSDLAVPTDIDRVKITTTSAASRAPLHEYTFMLGPGDQRVVLPVREGLYPTNDSQAAIGVEAQGLLGQVLVVARTAVLSFVPGKQVVLDLSLLASCKRLTCPTGQTCGPNGCQPETVVGSDLPIYKPGLTPPSSPSIDASVADANGGSALDTGEDRPGDITREVPAISADAFHDGALDRPEQTGTTTETSTTSGTGSEATDTGTGTGSTQTQSNTSAETGTQSATKGTGSSGVTGTGSGATATNTGKTTATVTGSGATATVTAATATQTSLSTAQTATGTGTVTSTVTATATGTGTGTGSSTGTATKTGTMTIIGTTVITGLVTGTASATTTLNITVPSATTAIITETITGTATDIGTASQTYSLTQTSTAASTSTATSSAGAMAMTYLLLTKDDSLPAATDTSTSTQTVGTVVVQDQSGNHFCGTGTYEKTYGCNAYMDYVAAGEGNLFAPSSTRYQLTTSSYSRFFDCAWFPTPTGKMSISVWVKPSQFNGSKQSILAWNFGDIQLFIDANGNAACLPVGSTPANVMALPLNQWTHLVCTQNATTWTLYMNGSTTKVTNTGPTTFRNPQPSSGVVNCLGYWYVSGWDLTNLSDPCGAGNQTATRFAGDLSLLRIYHDYTLSALEADNLHLCNNTACTGTILTTGTATASTTATVPVTITVTATATTAGTVPATSSETATGTVSTLVTGIGSTTATVIQTGTQTQVAHRLSGW